MCADAGFVMGAGGRRFLASLGMTKEFGNDREIIDVPSKLRSRRK
jgi:hypothetical protein